MGKLTIRLGLLIGLALASSSAGAAVVTCTSVATQQTDWNKTNAWVQPACGGGQPPAGATVIIANGTNILADANTNTVGNITIDAGGTLAIKKGNTISLSGNFTNNGTFTAPANSTVSFTGTSQTITCSPTTTCTFANLQVGANTVLTLTGNITVTGTVTGTLSLATTCPSNFTVTDAAGAILGQSCPIPPPIAEYRFDEGSAGTVADTSVNGLNGTLNGGVVVGGGGKVCGSYNFNGADAFVSVPNNALLNQAKVTVAAWVRHSDPAFKSWEAILAKGDTAYRMHLNGGCSINTPNTLDGLSFGINSGCNTAGADADSSVVPVANQWYHVVGTYDGATINIYVDGALKVSAAYAGAISGNTFPLYIGANSQQAGRFWSGDIDEVKIYSAALTAAQVATVYANENAGKNWDGTVRNCPTGFHVAIDAPATGMAFVAEPVLITPHTPAHAALAGAGTVVLSTSTGLGDWTIGSGTGRLVSGTANSGQATYTFGAGESSATLGFAYQSAGTVTLRINDTTGIDLLLNTPPAEKANSITFAVPSFVFTNGACVSGAAFGAAGQTCTPATWSPQIAGMDSAGIYITAVNASGVPTVLSQKNKVRTRNMQFGLSCHDPVADAGVSATFAGVTLPLCQGNGAKPATWSATTATVTFNAGSPSSNAAYAFNYADVGKVELWMQNSRTTTQVGASGAFVVKPGGFALSNIVRSSDGFANPAAANAAGAAFVGAGNAFGATVTATTCTPASATCTVTVAGAATPNYGKEKVPESVKLTANNVITGMIAPAPAVGGAFGTFGAAHPSGTPAGVAGVAHGTAFTWDEVGIITLTPSVGDGSYLGAGDVTGTASGNVGRFYPDHFDTAVVLSSNVPMICPAGLSCPILYNGFVYSGQPFSLTVTAKSASGATTQNYNLTTNFAKTVSLDAFGGLGATTTPAGAGTLGKTSVTAFTAGALTEAAEKYTFSTVPTVPTNIYIRASDGEASSMRASNPTTTSVEGGVAVVSGRIKVSNAYGSELLPLTLTANAQYFASAAGGWVNSITDGSTSLTLAASYDLLNKNGTKTGKTDASKSPAIGLAAGVLTITLAKPTAAGVATVAPTVAGCAIPATCYLPVIPGTATFGVYKGNNNYIYRREMY